MSEKDFFFILGLGLSSKDISISSFCYVYTLIENGLSKSPSGTIGDIAFFESGFSPYIETENRFGLPRTFIFGEIVTRFGFGIVYPAYGK